MPGFTFAVQAGMAPLLFDGNGNEAPGIFLYSEVTTDALSNIVAWDILWRREWLLESTDEFNNLFYYIYAVSVHTASPSPEYGFDIYFEATQAWNTPPSYESIGNEFSDARGVWRVNNVNGPTILLLFVFGSICLAVRKLKSHS